MVSQSAVPHSASGGPDRVPSYADAVAQTSLFSFDAVAAPSMARIRRSRSAYIVA